MGDRAYTKVPAQQKTLIGSVPQGSLLQRTCACGKHTTAGSECPACQSKHSSLLRSHRAIASPSAPLATQENASSLNAGAGSESRFGFDFSQISAHSSHSPILQTKLTVNQPGDAYEQEADQVANQVMRMPDTTSSSSSDKDEEETKPSLMCKPGSQTGNHAGTDIHSAPPIVHDVLNGGGGHPLDATTRAFMEPRFGHDFSQVRVHTDAQAAESARSVNALAYAVGKDVVFGVGQYVPGTSKGQRLLAHELTHVVQQSSGGGEDVGQSNEKRGLSILSTGISKLRGTIQRQPAKSASGSSTVEQKDEDPRKSPRYIDNLFQRVTYSWLNGATTFYWQENGKEQKISIPLHDLEQDDKRSFAAIFEVHASKEEALKKVKEWASVPSSFTFYSFYRTSGNIIMPTSFSIDSTPEFHNLWPKLKQQIAQDAKEIREGLQPIASFVNPYPGTRVDEYGNLHLSANPLDWLGVLLHLPKLRLPKGSGAGLPESLPKQLPEPHNIPPEKPVLPPHEPTPQIQGESPHSSSSQVSHPPSSTPESTAVVKQPPAGELAGEAKAGAPTVPQEAQLNKRIAEAEAELKSARQKTLDYQASRAAEGKSLKGGPIKKIWNIKERIWLLRRQKAFPGRTILEQPEIVGVKTQAGTVKPTEAIAGKGRTPDFAEVVGSGTVAGDLKSPSEVTGSIAGGVKKQGPIEGEFKDTSKIGQQHQVEKQILDEARKQGGKIVIKGRNVLTGEVMTIEVDPANYSSTVVTYEDVLPN